MNIYETSATVEEQGQVHLAGLPFAPGTVVEVTISPSVRSDATPTRPGDETARPAAALRWEGNVLVHQGVGAAPSVEELRDERLDRLGSGRSK